MAGLEGFDISHFQIPPLTAQRVGELIQHGYRHAGIKCSEGTYNTDANFAENRTACRAHGFPRWLYHEMTHERIGDQLQRIMESTGGHLYPRERLALVLGDFSVPPDLARDLVAALEDHGPSKRDPLRRPHVLIYANESLWKNVYLREPTLAARPRIVAAYPGPVDIDHVIHQYGGTANRDPATGGDRDRWNGTDPDVLMHFFRH